MVGYGIGPAHAARFARRYPKGGEFFQKKRDEATRTRMPGRNDSADSLLPILTFRVQVSKITITAGSCLGTHPKWDAARRRRVRRGVVLHSRFAPLRRADLVQHSVRCAAWTAV